MVARFCRPHVKSSPNACHAIFQSGRKSFKKSPNWRYTWGKVTSITSLSHKPIHVGGIPNVNRNWDENAKISKIPLPKFFACIIPHTTVCKHYKLRTFATPYCCSIVYLQHANGSYCGQNDVTVTACIFPVWQGRPKAPPAMKNASWKSLRTKNKKVTLLLQNFPGVTVIGPPLKRVRDRRGR